MVRMRNGIRLIALVFAASMVAGCETSGLFGPRDLAELSRAESRWRARPFADYRYEIRVSCFCPPEINRWTRVTVRDGAVVDAEAVDPDSPFPITTTLYWRPIDSLFAQVRRAMREPVWESAYSEIEVTYDRALGYPTFIAFREKPTVADAAATYELRNVRALEQALGRASAGFLVPPEEEDRNPDEGDDTAADAHHDAGELVVGVRGDPGQRRRQFEDAIERRL